MPINMPLRLSSPYPQDDVITEISSSDEQGQKYGPEHP
jgi:hypothetical protein